MTVELGKRLPAELLAATITDGAAHSVQLENLIGGEPTLLMFLRHFGCPACNLQVSTLAPRLLQLHELGVQTLFVSSGAVEDLLEFVERRNLADKKVRVFTDPELASYRAAGMHRSAVGTFGFSAVRGFVRAVGAGFRVRVRGDLTQQGGAVLSDASGIVRYLHRGRYMGDHADLGDVVETAMRLWIAGGSRPTGSV